MNIMWWKVFDKPIRNRWSFMSCLNKKKRFRACQWSYKYFCSATPLECRYENPCQPILIFIVVSCTSENVLQFLLSVLKRLEMYEVHPCLACCSPSQFFTLILIHKILGIDFLLPHNKLSSFQLQSSKPDLYNVMKFFLLIIVFHVPCTSSCILHKGMHVNSNKTAKSCTRQSRANETVSHIYMHYLNPGWWARAC